VYRFIYLSFSRGGNYFPGGSPWFVFHARIAKSKLTIIETCNIALNSSFLWLSKSLFTAFTRPKQKKLWVWQAARPNRVAHPGFLGSSPWFLMIYSLPPATQATQPSATTTKSQHFDHGDGQSKATTTKSTKHLTSILFIIAIVTLLPCCWLIVGFLEL
jgi:hypothetical protein